MNTIYVTDCDPASSKFCPLTSDSLVRHPDGTIRTAQGVAVAPWKGQAPPPPFLHGQAWDAATGKVSGPTVGGRQGRLTIDVSPEEAVWYQERIGQTVDVPGGGRVFVEGVWPDLTGRQTVLIRNADGDGAAPAEGPTVSAYGYGPDVRDLPPPEAGVKITYDRAAGDYRVQIGGVELAVPVQEITVRLDARTMVPEVTLKVVPRGPLEFDGPAASKLVGDALEVLPAEEGQALQKAWQETFGAIDDPAVRARVKALAADLHACRTRPAEDAAG